MRSTTHDRLALCAAVSAPVPTIEIWSLASPRPLLIRARPSAPPLAERLSDAEAALLSALRDLTEEVRVLRAGIEKEAAARACFNEAMLVESETYRRHLG